MKSLLYSVSGLARNKRRLMAGATALFICITAPLSQPLAGKAAIKPGKTQQTATALQETEKTFQGEGSGTLLAMLPSGEALGKCPLEHTKVEAKIAGYVARVSVKQEFVNTYKNKIEAIYTFPLSDTAAVDEMIMQVGNRTIHGTIKKREEAQQIYNNAKSQGKVASLLDQERTNIFTQSVANIEPGSKVEITIKYVDILPYDDGAFTFAFPTVVGPRFIPGQSTGSPDNRGRIAGTDAVPDASRITPPIASERAGHDIAINVHIDAAVPLKTVSSKLHQINEHKLNEHETDIVLTDKATIPNRDFVLTWTVAQDKLQSGYLTTKTDSSGYLSLMMLPPKKVHPEEIAPKEMIFLIDCSGSQSGAPLDKCKETMSYILDHMNDNDTFQIVSFSDHLRQFPDKPERVNAEIVAKARHFINDLTANGGTWMAPAVEKVCATPADENRLRIVTFMTDGYVGNDYEILGMVRKLRGNSRWFPFGTGNSINRLLIDGIAREGGGEPDYVLLNSPGNEVGKKFYDRIANPVLTNITLDFHGLPVKEVFPNTIADVWAEKPLYIIGKYTKPAKGIVTISGFAGGKRYTKDLPVVLPDRDPANAVLDSVWARKKVDRLMSEDYFGAQAGAVNKELKNEIIQTALDHHIMTQYTSFVAVEEKRITAGGPATTVPVPVELADGVSRQATVGAESQQRLGKSIGHRAQGVLSGAAAPVPIGQMAPSNIATGSPINFPRSGGYGCGGAAPAFAPAAISMSAKPHGRSVIMAQAPAATLPPPPLPAAPNETAQLMAAPPTLKAEPQRKQFNELKKADRIIATNDKKLEKERRDQFNDEASTKLKKDKLTANSKLSPLLRQLINNPSAQLPQLIRKNGSILIKITFKNAAKLHRAELKALAVGISKEAPYSVIAMVPINALQALAEIATVETIRETN